MTTRLACEATQCHQFRKAETRAWRGEATFPRSPSKRVPQPGTKPCPRAGAPLRLLLQAPPCRSLMGEPTHTSVALPRGPSLCLACPARHPRKPSPHQKHLSPSLRACMSSGQGGSPLPWAESAPLALSRRGLCPEGGPRSLLPTPPARHGAQPRQLFSVWADQAHE